MSATATLPNHLRPRREKVFGPARGIPLDRNAKTRIMVYARAWSAKRERQYERQYERRPDHQAERFHAVTPPCCGLVYPSGRRGIRTPDILRVRQAL